MIVLKFGGTSVQNAERIDKVLDITIAQVEQAPVLIASAMGKTTDRLVDIGEKAKQGDKDGAFEIIDNLKSSHVDTAASFLTAELLNEAREKLDSIFLELHSLVKGLALLKECSDRSSDALLSFGERLSTLLISLRAKERGIETTLLDSRAFIKTDDNFTSAAVDFKSTNQLIQEQIKPVPQSLIVAQGFIATTADNVTTTLGRGGSDYTATIIGAAIQADEVQIWTDVDGIMTSDPRLIPGAKTIPEISYAEAAELAYFGARVIHPSTIQPAIESNIPVRIKNTTNPGSAGTAIIKEADGKGLRALALKKNITLINITSSRMLNAYGFLRKIFEIFERYKTPVDLIATSEVSVSMTIDNFGQLDKIINDLNQIGSVSVEPEQSIVCLVGKYLWKQSEFIVRVFKSLEDISIRMISLGSSDINLSLVVALDKADISAKRLHQEFFGT
jgi:aspartate kinase